MCFGLRRRWRFSYVFGVVDASLGARKGATSRRNERLSEQWESALIGRPGELPAVNRVTV